MESYWRILVTYVLIKIPLLQHVKWVGEARMEAGRAVGRRLQGLQAKGVLGTMHYNGGRVAERRQVQIDVGDGTKKTADVLAVGNDS